MTHTTTTSNDTADTATDAYAIGVDYGTNSCRSLLIHLPTGTELGSAVFSYPSGTRGILTDPQDPLVARQSPQDYLDGLEHTITAALQQAAESSEHPDFDPSRVIGIGIDTTGSTPMPVNREGTPLALLPEFQDNLNAQAWLWKDHTSHQEAQEITALAASERPAYLQRCGGQYSSEWFWSKVLHLARIDPELFERAYSFVEYCDYLPAVLAGNTDPHTLKRSVCAAGHKALYHPSWGGLPDAEFLAQLDPRLAPLRERLYQDAYPAGVCAGTLCQTWADKLGLPEGIAISVGAFDAHMGAVGAGVKPGTLTKVLGTSTCDLMVAPLAPALQEMPGVCGFVEGSVLPDHYGIEAGQSAVGDLFLWLVDHLVPESYGKDTSAKFSAMEEAMRNDPPGASGLLALDWNNGNRCTLTDVRLSGLLIGQTLHTTAAEIYRTTIEATAFGALMIIRQIEAQGVEVQEIVTTGGLSLKNPTLMQIYADILDRPMRVSESEQTCALGAALFGGLAAGPEKFGYPNLLAAQERICAYRPQVYHPRPAEAATYAQLFELYQTLYRAFGEESWQGSLHHVMKDLMDIRDRANQTHSPA